MDDGLLALAESIAYERNEPPLTRDLIDRFGGKRGFIFNIRMWEAATRNGPACSHVPPGNHYRRRFEVLAMTGAAVRGIGVPIEQRLRALPMAVLQEAANAVGAGKVRSRTQAARLLGACAEIEGWLAARYDVEDFFLLSPEEWSCEELERLWHACEEEAERRS